MRRATPPVVRKGGHKVLRSRKSALAKGLRRLALWPRLAIAVTVGFLVLFGIFSGFSLRAVQESTDRVLQERLVVTQMAAAELDRLLGRAFYELEKATEFATFEPSAASQSEEVHVLAHTFGRIGSFTLGVYYLDPQGRVVLSEPPGKLPPGADLSAEDHIRRVRETGHRSVSNPFVDTASGKPAVALTIPLFRGDTLTSMLSGLIDVGSAEFTAPLTHARDLGHTGHAELMDHRGLAIVATDYGGFLRPGEHLDFYLRMLGTGGAAVENVPYIPWHPVSQGRQDERHIMAFVPLAEAPWGVAVGGSDWETLAPATRLRNTMLLGGAVSLAVLWLVALVGARLLVRPVRILTAAAHGMAAGDLEPAIRVGEGGEIGLLAESLEAMRVQLKESMDRMRRWAEELEARVEERTRELTARNRQLAVVTAVATAANEVRDMESMLQQCLEVILEHTGMDAGAIRLLDPYGQRLEIASAQGDFSGFPCQDRAVGLEECPCGLVAATQTPVFLGPEERTGFKPPCGAMGARGLAVLPLVSPKGVLGVLSLSQSGGEPLSPEARETLAAICNQLAIALENGQLFREVGRLQAQRELDRMKAEFISAISHELRTPLGIIKGFSTALLLDKAAVDPAIRHEFLQVIEEETDKLQRMIDDLLDMARLQAGRLLVEPRSTSLQELLESALRKASPLLQQRGHALLLPSLPEGVGVLADPGRVEQVLYNLLDNAVRYSPPGTPIEVKVTSGEEQVEVSVTDHGEGISPQDMEHIFEPFYRGANSQRASGRGAGLGLAICQGIVEAHGGRLWVERAFARGSTFAFTLLRAQGHDDSS